jgi:uncharacterized membrane protein YkvA (DUF1232 family)
MPIDLIPDFLPGIGVLDDVVLTIVALRHTAWVSSICARGGRALPMGSSCSCE